VDVNEVSGQSEGYGLTLLQHAASTGSAASVRLLLARGADVHRWSSGDDNNVSEVVAVQCAAEHGHLECLHLLIAAGGDHIEGYDEGKNSMGEPLSVALSYACEASKAGTISIAATLLGHGASRSPHWLADEAEQRRDRRRFRVPHVTSEIERMVARQVKSALLSPQHQNEDEPPRDVAAELHDTRALLTWLQSVRDWHTPLHFFEHISRPRLVELLREGACINAHMHPGGPSPFDRAFNLLLEPDAPGRDAALIVHAAAQPWTPELHYLWPKAARELATDLLCLAHQISRRFSREGFSGLRDALVRFMIPHALASRDCYEQPSEVVKGFVSDIVEDATFRLVAPLGCGPVYRIDG
jgi:hypothetical protein